MKKQAEHAEFEQIYKDTADMVFRFCLVKVSDREVALDLTQEVFTRLYQAMRAGKVLAHPKAWLFAVLKNLIIDWYRKKKPLSLEMVMERDEGAFEPTDERSYESIALSSEAQLVIKTFEKLGEDFREVLYLRYVEELEPKEIARILSITVNLVAVRMNRGMQELRTHLQTHAIKSII